MMTPLAHIFYACCILAVSIGAAALHGDLVELRAETEVLRGRGCPDQFGGHPFFLSSVQERTRTAVLSCYYATGVRS